MKRSLCLAVIGPTASGKSELAIEFARALNGEILCLDSTTVYKGFDIGTSKPGERERAVVPHHLLDLLEPEEPFSAYDFVCKAEKTIGEIEARGKLPILVGGTYFYLRALQHGMFPVRDIPADAMENVEKEFQEEDGINVEKMHEELTLNDPKAAEKIHPNDRYRLIRALAILRHTDQKPSELKPEPLSEAQAGRVWLKYAVLLSRHVLNQKIVDRTEKMIREGLVDEVRNLRDQTPQAKALGSIGYAETCDFLDEKYSEKQLRNKIIEHTRQFAKRQITWLRSDPNVRYIDSRDLARVELEVKNIQHALNTELNQEASR